MKPSFSTEQQIHHADNSEDRKDLLTFVTVCFIGEFSNLLLQARSLSLYGNGAIKKWMIVLNNEIEEEEKAKIITALEKELTEAKFNVTWIERKNVTELNLADMNGSRSQQILKICISHFIEDPFYVILDTKNHAIRELKKEFFLSENRPIVHRQQYEEWNPFYRWFSKAFSLLGLPLEKASFEKYQSTTPYVLETYIVRECMNNDLLLSSQPWHHFISLTWDDPDSTTEFALYGAVFEHYKRSAVFLDKQYVTLFDGHPNGQAEVMRYIGEINNESIKFFSVHRNRGFALNTEESTYLAECWISRGLFSSVENGITFLKNGLAEDYSIPH